MLYLCSSTISVPSNQLNRIKEAEEDIASIHSRSKTMKPALFLFLLVVQGILNPGIESYSVPTHVVQERGVQALNVTVGLHGDCSGEEQGGKTVALSRKGGGIGGGSGKGASGSGGSDISHRPRSKASAAPSTSSGPLFLLILCLACGALV